VLVASDKVVNVKQKVTRWFASPHHPESGSQDMEPSYQIKDGFPLFFRLISTVTPECTLLQDGVGSVQQHKRFLEVIRVSMRGGLMPCGATASKLHRAEPLKGATPRRGCGDTPDHSRRV
jgi:hypothetical protein